MLDARWGTWIAACSLALAGCGVARDGAEVAAGAAPRIALVDTSAHGPVLALHGPAPDGTLLVLCSTAVLEFDPRERELRERASIENVFTSEVGAFLGVDGAAEPWLCVAGTGGAIVQDLRGAVHYRLVPRHVGELSESRTYPSAERDGPDVLVAPDGLEWISVRLDRNAAYQHLWLPGSAAEAAPVLRSGAVWLASTDGAELGISAVGSLPRDPGRSEVRRASADEYLNACESVRDELGRLAPNRVAFGCYDRAREAQRWFEHALDTGATREISGLEYARRTEPERHAEYGGIALRGALHLEQGQLVGFSGAFVRVEAREASGALLWSDELRCDPDRRPFPRSTGAVRVVELDGRGLAIVGCAPGLALYDLGPAGR